MTKKKKTTPDEQLDQLLQLLDDAIERANITRSKLSEIMIADSSLVTKIFNKTASLHIGNFLVFVAPYLVMRGGLTEPAQIRKMAELLGYQLEIGDLLNIGIRAKKYLMVEDPPRIPQAFIERVEEEKRSSVALNSATSSINLQPVIDLPSLKALSQYLQCETVNLPGACGCQFPIDFAIDRTITVTPLIGSPILPDATDIPQDVMQMSGLLSGAAGSGRTTWMLKLTRAWAERWSESQPTPLAIYIKASAFLHYAGTRQSIFDFVANMVFPHRQSSPEQIGKLRETLETSDKIGKLLWLIDDFDRLSEAEQGTVIKHLISSSAIYTIYPWQTQSIAEQINTQHLGTFSLDNLSTEQQRQMLTKLAQRHAAEKFDFDLGCYALGEVAELSRLPLGVLAVYAQVAQHASNPALIVECALKEYFVRAGFGSSVFRGNWDIIKPEARTLLVCANAYLRDLVEQGETYAWTQDRAKITFESGSGCQWDYLIPTRLFEICQIDTPRGKTLGLRFCNRDILAFCAACYEPLALMQPYTTNPAYATLKSQAQFLAEAIQEVKGY